MNNRLNMKELWIYENYVTHKHLNLFFFLSNCFKVRYSLEPSIKK